MAMWLMSSIVDARPLGHCFNHDPINEERFQRREVENLQSLGRDHVTYWINFGCPRFSVWAKLMQGYFEMKAVDVWIDSFTCQKQELEQS